MRGAQQIQPEAPEIAAVALAIAVAGVAGELAAAGGFARWPRCTGVESNKRSPAQNDGEEMATWGMTLATAGATARSRLLQPGCLGSWGNGCPSRWRASAMNWLSLGMPTNICVTASAMSSASVILGGRPGPAAGGRRSSTHT